MVTGGADHTSVGIVSPHLSTGSGNPPMGVHLTDTNQTNDTPMTPEELQLFQAQLIAFTINLHAICVVSRWRRKRRCLVAGAPCLRRHWGLAQERIADLVWGENRI
jgi:hypothetical protein